MSHDQVSTSVLTSCICESTCTYTSSATQTLYANMTDELNSKLEEIVNAIKVDKSTLSSSVNKKISADDPRPSSTGIGVVGILMLVIVIGGIIVLDAPVLFSEFKMAAKRLRGGCFKSKYQHLNSECGCFHTGRKPWHRMICLLIDILLYSRGYCHMLRMILRSIYSTKQSSAIFRLLYTERLMEIKVWLHFEKSLNSIM